jgi:hypothetical protein
MSVQPRIYVMKAWVERRKESGHRPTADEIWARIHHNWPKMPAHEKELVFEAVD